MKVKSVAPYYYKDSINFKYSAYNGWIANNGSIASVHYPVRLFHRLIHKYDFPAICVCKSEARLRFVEPVSLYFDTFPDALFYEIIPFFWDVWPIYIDKVCKWLIKHHVRTAIFTSSQTAENIKNRFPEMNVLYCPEAIDSSLYSKGNVLHDRKFDYIEYGRCSRFVDSSLFDDRIKVLRSDNRVELKTQKDLSNALCDSKITLCLSKFYTDPDFAGGIDTLTQRFWEGLLSRNVILGHAPKELIDLFGYNPIIDVDIQNTNSQIIDILDDIDNYQDLVDRNYSVAVECASWTVRMKVVVDFLKKCGYEV